MKVYIDATPAQIELIRKTGSHDRSKAFPALEAFASILAPVIQVVLDKLATVRSIYSVKTLGENDVAEFPLDVFFDEQDNDIYVHFQSRPGGTPSSFLSELQTVIVPTDTYVGEVSWQNKFARAGRLDVIASYIHKLGQAMVRKEELNGWAVLMSTANATTNSLAHVVSSATVTGIFYPELLNAMLTRAKRINTSVGKGTAVAAPQGLTDIYLSPEAMADVRSFSYNPVNTRDASGGTPPDTDSGPVALPEDMRKQILAGAGLPSIFGLVLHELNELGLNFSYDKLFSSYYTGSFTKGTDEVVVGLDQSRDSSVLPIKGDLIVANDIFHSRSDKSGVIASEELGFAVLDDRNTIFGIIEGA